MSFKEIKRNLRVSQTRYKRAKFLCTVAEILAGIIFSFMMFLALIPRYTNGYTFLVSITAFLMLIVPEFIKYKLQYDMHMSRKAYDVYCRIHYGE